MARSAGATAIARSRSWPSSSTSSCTRPSLVLVVLSFNETGASVTWGGFSTHWYGELLESRRLIDSFKNTLLVGARGDRDLDRARHPARDRARAHRAQHGRSTARCSCRRSCPTSCSRSACCRSSRSSASRSDCTRSYRRARRVRHDLRRGDRADPAGVLRSIGRGGGAGPGREPAATFFRVTLPLIAPGIAAGALVAFTLSFDEFIIAFFTSGPTSSTFPIRVYSRIRFGLTPVVNAVAQLLLVVSFA